MLWRERNPSAGLSENGGFYRMKTRSDKEEEEKKSGEAKPTAKLVHLFPDERFRVMRES